jgi:hypothetical protein
MSCTFKKWDPLSSHFFIEVSPHAPTAQTSAAPRFAGFPQKPGRSDEISTWSLHPRPPRPTKSSGACPRLCLSPAYRRKGKNESSTIRLLLSLWQRENGLEMIQPGEGERAERKLGAPAAAFRLFGEARAAGRRIDPSLNQPRGKKREGKSEQAEGQCSARYSPPKNPETRRAERAPVERALPTSRHGSEPPPPRPL